MESCAKRSSARLLHNPHTTLSAAISLTSPPPILPVCNATTKKIAATIIPHKLSKRKFIIAVKATQMLIQLGDLTGLYILDGSDDKQDRDNNKLNYRRDHFTLSLPEQSARSSAPAVQNPRSAVPEAV